MTTASTAAVAFDYGIDYGIDTLLVTKSRMRHECDDEEDVEYAECRATTAVFDSWEETR